jgi:hypothetical protein
MTVFGDCFCFHSVATSVAFSSVVDIGRHQQDPRIENTCNALRYNCTETPPEANASPDQLLNVPRFHGADASTHEYRFRIYIEAYYELIRYSSYIITPSRHDLLHVSHFLL